MTDMLKARARVAMMILFGWTAAMLLILGPLVFFYPPAVAADAAVSGKLQTDVRQQSDGDRDIARLAGVLNAKVKEAMVWDRSPQARAAIIANITAVLRKLAQDDLIRLAAEVEQAELPRLRSVQGLDGSVLGFEIVTGRGAACYISLTGEAPAEPTGVQHQSGPPVNIDSLIRELERRYLR